jgi:hypothetical protein
MNKVYIALMVVLTACGEQTEKRTQGVPTTVTPVTEMPVDSVPSTTRPVAAVQAQDEAMDYCTQYSVMDADSLQFNGIGLETGLEELLREMGQPDSIVDPAYECGYFAAEGVPVKIYYYPAISFRVYEGMAEMHLIDFANDAVGLTYPRLKLNAQTTLEEIKIHFPASYANAYTLQDAADTRQYTFVRLLPKAGVDDQIVLKFFRGKLTAFELWMPC